MQNNALELATLALTAQRCFILALQNLGPNPMQLRNLIEIRRMNERLAELLELDVPSMEHLAKESMEIADLERLFRME